MFRDFILVQAAQSVPHLGGVPPPLILSSPTAPPAPDRPVFTIVDVLCRATF